MRIGGVAGSVGLEKRMLRGVEAQYVKLYVIAFFEVGLSCIEGLPLARLASVVAETDLSLLDRRPCGYRWLVRLGIGIDCFFLGCYVPLRLGLLAM